MATAPRDDNGYPTLAGASSADSVTAVAVRADPVTGYILMSIQPISGSSTTNPATRSDDNAVRLMTAVSNDASQTVKPLLADPNNTGYVLCDVLKL